MDDICSLSLWIDFHLLAAWSATPGSMNIKQAFFLSLGPNLGNNIPALLPGVENGGTSSSYHSVYAAWLYEPLHNELEWEEESDKAHAKGRE